MDEGSLHNTWYGSNLDFTTGIVTNGPSQNDITSQNYATDKALNATHNSQRGILIGPLTTEPRCILRGLPADGGNYSSGVFAEDKSSVGLFATTSPSSPSPLPSAKGRYSSSNDSYQLHRNPHSPSANEIKDTPQHIWRQTGNLSTTKSLSHLVLQVSINNVQTFLCGWNNCTHPVGFCQKAQLITHIRSVHLEEKPFKCITCGASFSRKQEAVRHVNSMNNGKIYKCSFCQKSFVRRHIRDHHEDTCVMCDN